MKNSCKIATFLSDFSETTVLCVYKHKTHKLYAFGDFCLAFVAHAPTAGEPLLRWCGFQPVSGGERYEAAANCGVDFGQRREELLQHATSYMAKKEGYWYWL